MCLCMLGRGGGVSGYGLMVMPECSEPTGARHDEETEQGTRRRHRCSGKMADVIESSPPPPKKDIQTEHFKD
jgi:hypothetical protein